LPSALGAQGSGDGGSGMGRSSEKEQVNLASIEEGIRAMTNVGAHRVARYWGRWKPGRRRSRGRGGGLWAAVSQCLTGTGDRARLPWTLTIWPVGRGPLKLGGL
jgi:hypothetical protein